MESVVITNAGAAWGGTVNHRRPVPAATGAPGSTSKVKSRLYLRYLRAQPFHQLHSRRKVVPVCPRADVHSAPRHEQRTNRDGPMPLATVCGYFQMCSWCDCPGSLQPAQQLLRATVNRVNGAVRMSQRSATSVSRSHTGERERLAGWSKRRRSAGGRGGRVLTLGISTFDQPQP